MVCIQDTLLTRAAHGLPAAKADCAREQRYLEYKSMVILTESGILFQYFICLIFILPYTARDHAKSLRLSW